MEAGRCQVEVGEAVLDGGAGSGGVDPGQQRGRVGARRQRHRVRVVERRATRGGPCVRPELARQTVGSAHHCAPLGVVAGGGLDQGLRGVVTSADHDDSGPARRTVFRSAHQARALARARVRELASSPWLAQDNCQPRGRFSLRRSPRGNGVGASIWATKGCGRTWLAELTLSVDTPQPVVGGEGTFGPPGVLVQDRARVASVSTTSSVGFAASIGGIAGASLAAHRGVRTAAGAALVGAIGLGASEAVARAASRRARSRHCGSGSR